MKQGIMGRMMQRFFVRTFTSFFTIIALVFLLLFIISQGTIKSYYTENTRTHLNQVAIALTPKILDLFQNNDFENLDRLAKDLGKKTRIRLTVIIPDGKVIADSEYDPQTMENHKDRPEIFQALKGEKSDSTRFSSTMGEQMLYLAIPVDKDGELQFILRVSLYLGAMNLLMENLREKITVALLVLFLLAVVMSWYFSRGIAKPVSEIVQATRQFAGGNFEVKIFLKKQDELGEVARSFNNMVVQQKQLFDELNANREELKAIISSMKEGLLVIKLDGKVSLFNESFEQMMGHACRQGEYYWEMFRVPSFEEYVQRVFKTEESFSQEIELDDKVYLVDFNRMPHLEKSVIIFRDITSFKQLDRMKKDFIVNLTHELKTPLTAIKGFVETLEEEEKIEHTNYLDIIKRHTNRMNQIVSDLLTLSELEEENRETQFTSLYLEKIVMNILNIFREKIREKNLELKVDIQENLPQVQGELFKMEQMFINLLDNAVKYTDKGSISVWMKHEAGQNFIQVGVQNTGVPIPEKSLARIFERFYVVDKSRSRKLGGTGLGLSIVKHVVLLHQGEITVKSSIEEGTVFLVKLPING